MKGKESSNATNTPITTLDRITTGAPTRSLPSLHNNTNEYTDCNGVPVSRLQALCADCQEPAVLTGSIPFYDYSESLDRLGAATKHTGELHTQKCGHLLYTASQGRQEVLPPRSFHSLDGKKETYPFQVEGLDFIKQTGFNCLIGDQQGLGKTIQALLAVREYHAELVPCLLVVKSATLWQWQREIKEWCDRLPSAVWMIRSSRDLVPPGFSIYLISMDTLRSFVKSNGEKRKKTKSIFDTIQSTSQQNFSVDPRFLAIGFKSLIADEIHSFKNEDSRRSQALVELVRILQIKHKIFLSGTAIKNRAEEYFVTLNLLDPLNFPSKDNFKHRFLAQDEAGRWSRLDPALAPAFKDLTSTYVLRRERNQVMKDLPAFSRVFEEVLIESDALKKLYEKELEKLRAKQDDKISGELNYNDIKDQLMTMRRIIGQAKAELVVDTIEEFMDSTDNEKVVIGVHHVQVREYLIAKLARFRPLSLSGEDSSDRKALLVEAFKRPERRLMIVNIIAGGTGLNLQFCNNCIVLERQWNAADEEQFEDRFNRIGQTLPVTAAYPVALRTIDEWFYQKVETTRQIFGETIAVNPETWMGAAEISEMINWAVNQKL